MFQKRLADCAEQVDACLGLAFDRYGNNEISSAMRYTTSGGKRLRAFLAMEGAALHGIADSRSVWAASAVESLHAYSLVHDDLPCMDDDDLRRGQPTVHVKWNEATAVLVGDALQTMAFELLTRDELCADPVVKLNLIRSLAVASGADGMVLGQAQDIAAETAKSPLTLSEITDLQANKTGALMCWSAEVGAVMAGADIAPMRHYSTALGLAFQIADDILDVEGDAATVGKRVGKDADAGKATFVSLLGMDGAKRRAQELVDEAEEALVSFGNSALALRQAAQFVISRNS